MSTHQRARAISIGRLLAYLDGAVSLVTGIDVSLLPEEDARRIRVCHDMLCGLSQRSWEMAEEYRKSGKTVP